MKVYYCEVAGKFEPHFDGYVTQASNDADAITWFKKKHGVRLELVYYEKNEKEIEIVWTEETEYS